MMQLKAALPMLFELIYHGPGMALSTRTAISDRAKGLQNAVDEFFPLAHKAYCCWHLQQNIKDHHGGAKAAKLF